LNPDPGARKRWNEALDKHAFGCQIDYSTIPAVSTRLTPSSQKVSKLGSVSRRGTRTNSAHKLNLLSRSWQLSGLVCSV
jgi:hypothetical protein